MAITILCRSRRTPLGKHSILQFCAAFILRHFVHCASKSARRYRSRNTLARLCGIHRSLANSPSRPGSVGGLSVGGLIPKVSLCYDSMERMLDPIGECAVNGC